MLSATHFGGKFVISNATNYDTFAFSTPNSNWSQITRALDEAGYNPNKGQPSKWINLPTKLVIFTGKDANMPREKFDKHKERIKSDRIKGISTDTFLKRISDNPDVLK
jgi:hypothetical protein